MFWKQPDGDKAIVARVLRGDREVFGLLVDRYARLAYVVAFAHVRNHADAEDVTQESFTQAFQGLDRLREPAKFKQWLMSIVRHVAGGQAAQRRRRTQLELGEGADMINPGPAIEAREREALVRSQLAKLSPAHGEVLALHYLAGKSTAEIAGLIGESRTTVKKRLERGRAELTSKCIEDLRAAFAPGGPEEPALRHRIMTGVMALPVPWLGGAPGQAVKPVLTAAAAGTATITVGTALKVLATVIGIAAAGYFGYRAAFPEEPARAAPVSRPAQWKFVPWVVHQAGHYTAPPSSPSPAGQQGATGK